MIKPLIVIEVVEAKENEDVSDSSSCERERVE